MTRNSPRTVLDIGSGWGELMLRILAAAPEATGLALDTDEGDLARGRDNARARGLVDQHRSFWLRGYYGLLGQAYLTLVPAS